MIHRFRLPSPAAIALALCLARPAGATNPILPGFADPALAVHAGRMYLAVGKDGDPKAKGRENCISIGCGSGPTRREPQARLTHAAI